MGGSYQKPSKTFGSSAERMARLRTFPGLP
jgi:hypothetical protein